DPDTADAGEVDAWLDGCDVARDEDGVALRSERGRLVEVEADTVTKSVPVAITEPRRVDSDAGGCIDVARPRPGAHGFKSVELRPQAKPVRVGEVGGQLARCECHREVGA